MLFLSLEEEMNLNAWTHKQIHTPPWYKGRGGGGVDRAPPWSFDMLQHIETILRLVESLCHDLRIFYG